MPSTTQPASDPRHGGWWYVTSLVLVLFLAGLLVFMLVTSIFEIRHPTAFVLRSGPVPFERAAWRDDATPFLSEPIRLRMARHLRDSGELMGKSETEIHAMLDSDRDHGTNVGTDLLSYCVRVQGDSDMTCLQLELDADRRVVRVFGVER